MAVFRIERTRDYTVMSNHHLRDKALSLKSKGLLSMMLSLPEDWNYTTRGLAKICKEGVDAIGGALRSWKPPGTSSATRCGTAKDALSQSCMAEQEMKNCRSEVPAIFGLYFCANFVDQISAKGKFGSIVTAQSK